MSLAESENKNNIMALVLKAFHAAGCYLPFLVGIQLIDSAVVRHQRREHRRLKVCRVLSQRFPDEMQPHGNPREAFFDAFDAGTRDLPRDYWKDNHPKP